MMERNTERLSTSWRESGCSMYTYREEGVRMGTTAALAWARTGRREAGGGDVELGTTLVLAVARTERREAGCGDGDDTRACCSRYGEEGKAEAEAAMGMAPALAAGGPVQRRKGVRAGRAEVAAMEE